jgi:hypothetical protein
MLSLSIFADRMPNTLNYIKCKLKGLYFLFAILISSFPFQASGSAFFAKLAIKSQTEAIGIQSESGISIHPRDIHYTEFFINADSKDTPASAPKGSEDPDDKFEKDNADDDLKVNYAELTPNYFHLEKGQPPRKAIQSSPSALAVLLFILYHSWKSFLL